MKVRVLKPGEVVVDAATLIQLYWAARAAAGDPCDGLPGSKAREEHCLVIDALWRELRTRR